MVPTMTLTKIDELTSVYGADDYQSFNASLIVICEDLISQGYDFNGMLSFLKNDIEAISLMNIEDCSKCKRTYFSLKLEELRHNCEVNGIILA